RAGSLAGPGRLSPLAGPWFSNLVGSCRPLTVIHSAPGRCARLLENVRAPRQPIARVTGRQAVFGGQGKSVLPSVACYDHAKSGGRYMEMWRTCRPSRCTLCRHKDLRRWTTAPRRGGKLAQGSALEQGSLATATRGV